MIDQRRDEDLLIIASRFKALDAGGNVLGHSLITSSTPDLATTTVVCTVLEKSSDFLLFDVASAGIGRIARLREIERLSTRMSSIDLSEQVLLKNNPPPGFPAEITHNDGRVASLHPRTREFITSPNCSFIPFPPFGSTRDLYRREDGFYANDDPVLWPQPLNRRNIYLTCVPRHPNSENHPYFEDACMWQSISENSVQYEGGRRNRGEGLLWPQLPAQLDYTVQRLRSRTRAYHNSTTKDLQVSRLLQEFDSTLTVCLARITSVQMSLRDIRRAVAEIQRSWLYSVALLDYMDRFRNCTLEQDRRRDAEVGNRMGAFVWNDRDALELWNSGIPVFFIRPYTAFHNQLVLQVKPLTLPRLCTTAASPPYPILLSQSQAGSDEKFAAICQASISCFEVASPFANMHLLGAYSTSYIPGSSSRSIVSPTQSLPSTSSTSQVGPSRTVSTALLSSPYSKGAEHRQRGKKKRVNPPQAHRDLFTDITHPQLPSVFPSWSGMNASIDEHHSGRQHSPGKSPKLLTIVPDPSMIFGSSEDGKHELLLEQWQRLRERWLARCRDPDIPVAPVSNAVWKKALSLSTIGNWPDGKTPQTGSERDHEAASKLVSTVLPLNQRGPIPSPTIPHSESTGKVLQELSLINFRHQLVSLDLAADQSAQQPSPSVTQADLKVLQASHRRDRGQLIDRIFGNAGDMFTVSEATFVNGFLAERWADRVESLRAFAALMISWPGEKDGVWNRGNDANLPLLVGPGMEWEKILFRFYVQSYFNFFSHPPILPRRHCL